MSELAKLTAENKGPVVFLTIESGGESKIITGRDAWALSELISAGRLVFASFCRTTRKDGAKGFAPLPALEGAWR